MNLKENAMKEPGANDLAGQLPRRRGRDPTGREPRCFRGFAPERETVNPFLIQLAAAIVEADAKHSKTVGTEGKNMFTVEVAPGLVLDEAMYEVAAAGILEYAPDVAPLTKETFVAPTGWWIIPDDDCVGYKAELVLRNDRDRTIKLNNWYLPDLRGGEESRPHSHPWRVD
ncbi:hypothetical protein MOQ72_34180 [Saccharopolyspora sp. K220]|uniref:hypothetical protein n=1 Tax=Saccharopolyspora soli TaxID=2926618 RepID=UPI001F58038E|nr:hypothetical protein [Saccharopolyspora soli]MCI2422488.1 hypothetical protein [Saccharopolyspora soli]